MSNIDQAVADLAKKIKEGVKIEVKDGAAVVTIDENIAINQFSDPAAAKKTFEELGTFFPAATLAGGELAVPVFEANKDLEKIEFAFPLVGKKDTWNVAINRTSTTRNPAKPEETITKYGSVSTGLDIYEADHKKGQLKKVKEHIGQTAAAALAD